MIYMVEATYPGSKAVEAATRFLELFKTNPIPEGVRIIDLYAYGGGDGYVATTYYEIAKGKEEEGLKYIATGMVELLNNIEGYKTEAHMVYNMESALDFLGMKAPAL